MRRALIIGASIIVLFGGALTAYYYFFANTPSLSVAPSTSLPSAAGNESQTLTNGNDNPAVPAATKVTARLVKISQGPVVPGVVVVDMVASSSTDVDVRFIERQSGNIFSYLVHEEALTRTSNRTLPGIAEAHWLPSGQTVFVRYLSGDTLSTINTYGLMADGSSGFFLPQDLVGIAVSSTSILALASGANGSVASLMHTDGTRASTLFSSPLSSLRVLLGGKDQYFAFTKPAQSLLGDLFLIDKAGNFSRLAGPLPGLVALASPSGKEVLVSYMADGVMRMALVNTATRAVTRLPVATIADKCVWAADDSAVYCGIPTAPSREYSYPDDWYQGAIPFNDRIWRISVGGRYAQLVLDFSLANSGLLDATALATDRAGTALIFVNKNDGSLWSYQL